MAGLLKQAIVVLSLLLVININNGKCQDQMKMVRNEHEAAKYTKKMNSVSPEEMKLIHQEIVKIDQEIVSLLRSKYASFNNVSPQCFEDTVTMLEDATKGFAELYAVQSE